MSSSRSLSIWAHRAYGNYECHNSVNSFRKASVSKLHGVETDIFLTKDLIPVVLHGETLSGVAKLRPVGSKDSYRKIIVTSLTLKELQEYEYNVTGEKVPTLEEILEIVKPSQLLFNAEIKDTDRRTAGVILDTFVKFNMLDRLFISSFIHYHAQELRKAAELRGISSLPFGYLTFNTSIPNLEEILRSRTEGDTFIMPYDTVAGVPELYTKFAKLAIDNGFKLSVWYGCDFEAEESLGEYSKLMELGVSCIISNQPDIALRNHELLQSTE